MYPVVHRKVIFTYSQALNKTKKWSIIFSFLCVLAFPNVKKTSRHDMVATSTNFNLPLEPKFPPFVLSPRQWYVSGKFCTIFLRYNRFVVS